MNESLFIYLNFEDEKDMIANEKLIQKIDRMLLPLGVKYSGFMNCYRPVDQKYRDDIIFDASEQLKNCEWLKPYLAYVLIGNETKSIDGIDCAEMAEPSKEKLSYYETYYKETSKLPHGILIDENNCIVDGYISYLLWKKYNPQGLEQCRIYKVESDIPHKKIVTGRHVEFNEEKIIIKNAKYYRWIYNKSAPVIPGDVLAVQTRKGKAYMVVEDIDYIAGAKYCNKYKRIINHTGRRMNL